MKIILGDNPFFDINHNTGGSDLGFQYDIMDTVIAEYIKHKNPLVMLSDHLEFHDELFKILNKYKGEDLSLALLAPVPHTINALVASGGYRALFKNIGLKSAIIGAPGLICHLLNLTRLSSFFYKFSIKHYIKHQLKPYLSNNINVSHFGIHNVFADMLLASNNTSILNSFIGAVEDLGLSPIILTQNIGAFLELKGLHQCIICGSVNPLGYMMSPSKKVSENVIKSNKYNHTIWAMQILAGGSVKLNDSLKYLNNLNLNSIVYATSKKDRIDKIFNLLSS